MATVFCFKHSCQRVKACQSIMPNRAPVSDVTHPILFLDQKYAKNAENQTGIFFTGKIDKLIWSVHNKICL
jgi:hypothetical protein